MAIDLSEVPSAPGVYTFRGSGEKIIYVGKARNLKNRMRSYFNASSGLDARKLTMVSEIKDFSFIATANELEAWILEANLIKLHRPKYNVVLRDDKNYPYIKITTAEKWPRIEVVRRTQKDGNLYFGPYIPAQAMREAIAFIRKNFRIRICSHQLDRPQKPCIQYQMGRCPAPCDNRVSTEDYAAAVNEIVLFLRGERKELLTHLEQQMHQLSEEMCYEEAAAVRDSISRLMKAFESQKIIAPELGDLDVIGLYSPPGSSRAGISLLFVRSGMMIGARDFRIDNQLGNEESELMRAFIEAFYSRQVSPAQNLVLSVMPEDREALCAWLMKSSGEKVRLSSPREGKKRELVNMAVENARLHLGSGADEAGEADSAALASLLALAELPRSIAAFDVSTLQGSESVGALVWWEEGRFNKEMYRHLKIKSVEGVDDYAMMHETVGRLMQKLGSRVPDLILIDGGKGQLDVGIKALSEAGIKTEVIGIAKKPDRAILADGGIIDIELRNRAALLLRRIRDEAHRFVISFHRRLRDKRLSESVLENVQGIGKSRRLELLRKFGSIDAMRQASAEEIATVKGINMEIAAAILAAIKKGEDG